MLVGVDAVWSLRHPEVSRAVVLKKMKPANRTGFFPSPVLRDDFREVRGLRSDGFSFFAMSGSEQALTISSQNR